MALPQLTSPKLFLTESGMETTLFYKHKVDMPCLSTLPALETDSARKLISQYYKAYIDVAAAHETGIVLDTRTWRGSAPWAKPLGWSMDKLLEMNRSAVQLAQSARSTAHGGPANIPIVISGTMGPVGDAYADSSDSVTLEKAREAYKEQAYELADAGVDLLALYTASNLNEAIAVVELAKEVGLPAVVSFNIESNGLMIGGRTLESAIRTVDETTNGYTSYFGVNCAHPLRIVGALKDVPEDVRKRIGLIKANASLKTHEELDGTPVLDRGDIPVFADGFEQALPYLPNLKVVGGCCGTDEEHLEAIAKRCV